MRHSKETRNTKNDWTMPAILLEAVTILMVIGYLGLQVFYGLLYHVDIEKIVINLGIGLLLYAIFWILTISPEKINQLPAERCVGKVRTYSIWMMRVIKFLFIAGLLVPSICDIMSVTLNRYYHAAFIFILIDVALLFEWKVIIELRKQNNEE